MPSDNLSLFLQFNDAVPQIGHHQLENRSWFEDFQSQIDGLDPVKTDAVCRAQLKSIAVDDRLIRLYEQVDDFQTAAMGDGYRYELRHPFVAETINLLKEVLSVEEPTEADMDTFINLVQKELGKYSRVRFLKRLLQQHADEVYQAKIQTLEEKVGLLETSGEPQPVRGYKADGEFTQVQQALALRYLFHDALGVGNIDNTRLIAVGHLLAAKPIPRKNETGTWNIVNSGLKSAFTKATNRSGPSYLADLQFVLRVFQPLWGQGGGAFDRAIAALERDIKREEQKLKKTRD